MGTFRMPSLGADMSAGTLIEWRVKPGDRVRRGDIIAEVETDKADVEVEVFEDGIVDRLLVPPGTKVPVGTALAELRPDGATAPAPEPAAVAPPAVAPPAVAPPVVAPPVVAPPVVAPPVVAPPAVTSKESAAAEPAHATPSGPAPSAAHPDHLRASPLARRLAAEIGLDLALIHGTGPGGVIERADVERERDRASKRPSEPASARGAEEGAGGATTMPSPEAARAEPGDARDRMREAIAATMSRSHREIPHYYLQNAINLHHALRWLEERNASRAASERILPAALFIKAVARALVDAPELNGYWLDGRHRPQRSINVGIAISLRGGGLVAPAIHDADKLSIDQLMAAMSDLIARAREGRLRSSEMSDATITITNLGDLGVDVVHGIIFPPQLALVGFGRIAERPWAENGLIGARPVVEATLAADHRATDGHRGARFLTIVTSNLQTPEEL